MGRMAPPSSPPERAGDYTRCTLVKSSRGTRVAPAQPRGPGGGRWSWAEEGAPLLAQAGVPWPAGRPESCPPGVPHGRTVRHSLMAASGAARALASIMNAHAASDSPAPAPAGMHFGSAAAPVVSGCAGHSPLPSPVSGRKRGGGGERGGEPSKGGTARTVSRPSMDCSRRRAWLGRAEECCCGGAVARGGRPPAAAAAAGTGRAAVTAAGGQRAQGSVKVGTWAPQGGGALFWSLQCEPGAKGQGPSAQNFCEHSPTTGLLHATPSRKSAAAACFHPIASLLAGWDGGLRCDCGARAHMAASTGGHCPWLRATKAVFE